MSYVIIKEPARVEGWGRDAEVVAGKVLFEGNINNVPQKGDKIDGIGKGVYVDAVVNNISNSTITLFVKKEK